MFLFRTPTREKGHSQPVPTSRGEKSPEESAVERNHDFNTLQRFRLQYWEEDRYETPILTVAAAFLRTEESLRKICQTEIALKNKPETPSTIQILKKLNQNSWFLQREWWYLQSEITGSPSVIERAFTQWRSDPQWYMHHVLVEDCINRGGCCGRSCGCCVSYERETTSADKLGIGHCTVECGCCYEARGFELTLEEKKEFERRFGFLDMDVMGEVEDYAYQHRIYFASIWGLSRNDSATDYQWAFKKSVSVPIFQSRLIEYDGANNRGSSTIGDSKMLFGDDHGEESDLTIIGT